MVFTLLFTNNRGFNFILVVGKIKYLITTKYFRLGFSFLFQRLKNKEIVGITNRTKDGLYTVFIDYDGLEINLIIEELDRIQQDFNLSHFYLFRSSKKGIHAVCFDKLPMRKFIEVLNNSSADYNFIQVPLKYGSKQWNLRISEKEQKPEYIGVKFSDKTYYNKSSALMDFFKERYNIFIDRENEDKLEKNIYICKYKI